MPLHPHKYKIEYRPKDVSKIIAHLKLQKRPLGLDIETAKHEDYLEHPQAALTPQLSHIRLIQIAAAPNVFVFDVYELTPKQKAELLQFIGKHEFFAHAAQFEAAHFQTAGVKKLNVHCTQIMYRMLVRATTAISDSKDIPASLAAVCQDILNITVDKSDQTSNWNDPELSEDQIRYAGRDAAYVDVLGPAFLKKVTQMMPKAYKLNKDMINPLARMTRNGFYFDIKAHAKCVEGWKKKEVKLLKRLKKRYGDMNFNSTKQIGQLIREHFPPEVVEVWPRTPPSKTYPEGNLKTGADIWLEFKEVPGIEDICEYKKNSTKLSRYAESLSDPVNPVTKRIHASYSLGYTSTGRLSSFDPNLQNIIRGPEVRQFFKHQYKKTVLIGADFSQIEAKIAALLSHDPELLHVFRTGADLYITAASQILGIKASRIKKDSVERQVGKSAALGLLYGMGWKKYKEHAWTQFGVKMTDKEAKVRHARFFEWLHVYRQWQKDTAEEAYHSKEARTMFGKIRRLDKYNYYTCSMNTPNQGSAAEIMKRAFIRVDNALRKKKLKARIVNQVHDELDIECFKEHTDRVVKITKSRMERGFRDVFPDTMGIKKLVDVKVGLNWAEVK